MLFFSSQFIARVFSFTAIFSVVKSFHISKPHNFYLHICWQFETYANIKKWWKRLKSYFDAFRFGWFCDECVFNKKQDRKWVEIAKATCVTVRIMKQENQTVTENYLRRLNQEREPVTFKKLSKTPKGDYFF